MKDCHQTTPAYYEPEQVSEDPDQHKLRVQIDEVATMRGLTTQMSLRLMTMVSAPDEVIRTEARNEFLEMAHQFGSIMDMLFGVDRCGDVSQETLDWMRNITRSCPKRQEAMVSVRRRIEALATSLKNGHPASFEEARKFYEENFPIVRDQMTTIIWDLWADLDSHANTSQSHIDELHRTLHITLGDIKKFSVAVRMIALNTAVLASRPADAGQGFKAIASEVKTLAEEIQSSTSRAEKVVNSMNRQF